MKQRPLSRILSGQWAGLRSTRVHRAGWENSVEAWHLVTEKIGKGSLSLTKYTFIRDKVFFRLLKVELKN